MVLADHDFSPFQGSVPSQHSLILGAEPYCGLTVHDQRSSSWTSTVGRRGHRHMGRSWYPPLVLTDCSAREELPGLLWTVSLRNSTTVDAVHPQSGKFQTDRATVQGHMVHSEEVVSWRYKQGERFCSYIASVTASSTLPQSMKEW